MTADIRLVGLREVSTDMYYPIIEVNRRNYEALEAEPIFILTRRWDMSGPELLSIVIKAQ